MRCVPAIVFCAWACAAQAQPSIRPTERQIVEAQGQYARAQLGALAALLGTAPAASAREAFASGGAAIDWTHWSPALGGVARGPTLSESLAPLLANLAAQRAGCDRLEGPCQDRALAAGRRAAKDILKSQHPGAALAAAIKEER